MDHETPPLPLMGGASAAPTVTPALLLLVREFEAVETAVESLTEQRKALAERIAAECRIGADAVNEGTTLALGDGRYLLVERGERWKWDQDQLRELMQELEPAVALSPDEVEAEALRAIDMRVGIKRNKYDALSSEAQALVQHALTRLPGTLSIKITT